MFSKCIQRLITNSKTFPKDLSNLRYKFNFRSLFTRTFSRKGISIGFCLVCSATAGGFLYLSSKGKVLGKSLEYVDNSMPRQVDYEPIIEQCRDLIVRLKDEVGVPGVVVGVSVNGESVWEEGFGYADIENRVHCHPATVMRIASISKSITMAAVAKLYEEGKLDLDKPVQHYVPDFPKKAYNGVPVEITCRQLVSHLAGIRHYRTKSSQSDSNVKNEKNLQPRKTGTNNGPNSELSLEEYYIKDKFPDVRSSLDLFKDDPLVNKPGTKYHYSTFAWTLISAIVEKAADEKFTIHMEKLFKILGMNYTYLDDNEVLIYHRSRNYTKNAKKHIINTKYVDNSYKWAGGGFLSTVGDLLKFANAMLYSQQYNPEIVSAKSTDNKNTISKESSTKTESSITEVEKQIEKKDVVDPTKPLPEIEKKLLTGYLKSKTLQLIWKPVVNITGKEFYYAMGWFVLPEKQTCEYCNIQRFSVAHTGGAIGASSALVILPKKCQASDPLQCQYSSPPKGVSVVIIGNLQDVSFLKTALDIAQLFEKQSLNR